MNGLVREAIDKALADSGSTFDDIDAVVVGKAPDFFEGVMMPELFMADAVGATGKPLIRVHTAGSVGGSTARRRGQPGAVRQVQARADDGVGEAVGVECHVGVEHSGAVHQAGRRGRGRLLRPARAVLHPALGRTDAHRRDGRGQGPAQRREEPAGPPAPAGHHAGEGDGVPDAVGPDPLRRDLPVVRRRLRAGDRQRGDRRHAGRRRPPRRVDPRHRAAHRTAGLLRPRPGQPAGRPRRRQRRCGATQGSPARSTRSTSPRSTCRSPGSSRCGWRTSGFAPEGEGWKLTEAGETAIGGRIPFNPSGGVLSSNPIGASGMIRFAESAIQVMGKAGDHQVEGARKALGHAYGGGSQYYSMWVVGSDKPVDKSACSTPCSVAMSPIDQLDRDRQDRRRSRVRHRSRCRTRSSTWRSSRRTIPYTADGSRMWNAEHPVGRPADRRGRDGRGDVDAALLHQRDEARVRATRCCWRARWARWRT